MSNNRGGLHILAVDDSAVDMKLLEKLLKTSSLQVTTVDSGLKALEVLGLNGGYPESKSNDGVQDGGFNLIMTDYCMPGMNGFELLRTIKESTNFKDIPVVIMSSENEQSRIERCLEEGAADFILKPVRMSDVNSIILKEYLKFQGI